MDLEPGGRVAKTDPRHHWGLKPGVVFLNHGSFGACPRPVLELQSELRSEMEAEPVQFLWRRYEERLDPSRRALARFVGAKVRDLVFVTNATAAVNAVIRSFPLTRGDEILTTNLDYNACHNVLLEAVRVKGARLKVANVPFPVSGPRPVLDAVMVAVGRRTRLALIDHVTSDTGMILPVKELVRDLESRGVAVMVDGAHAPGMVPLRLDRLGASFYAGNLHKWVCAPKGAAFLWVREDRQEAVQPAVISHGNNRTRRGYSRFQDRFDWGGTLDPTPWFCVGKALEWMGSHLEGGWSALRSRNHQLVLEARRLLCRELGVAAVCPESMLGSLATIPLPGRFQGRPARGRIDPEQLELHDRFGIEVPLSRIGSPARRHFRVSAQVYNTLEDYRTLAAAISQLK